MPIVENVSDAHHWKLLTDAEFIGAYALEPGKDLVVTIDHVELGTVTSNTGKKERKPIAYFMDYELPMVLNNTNMKTIEKIHGTADPNKWGGKKIQLYADKTRLAGDLVDCLRIRKFVPHEDAKIKCERCGEFLKAYDKMSAVELKNYTQKRYGKVLCTNCATLARKAAAKAEPFGNSEQLHEAGETHEGEAK